MSHEPDYYAILGVSPTSEEVVIQAAYRALMRRYHPDTNPSPEAVQRTIEINQAYAVLSSPTDRAAYDARRNSSGSQRAESTHSADADSAVTPPNDPRDRGYSAAEERSRSAGAILVFALLVLASGSLAGLLAIKKTHGLRDGNSQSSNVMNVDENLTTTDMNAADPGPDPPGATSEIPPVNTENLSGELNQIVPAQSPTPTLAGAMPSAVSYSTVEAAAWRFTSVLKSRGLIGARTYSERCHKAVQSAPTWDGEDSCAAFDFAAAYVDSAVSNKLGFAPNGYFAFQTSNEADNYAAVGAPSYLLGSRLSEIRQAAQNSAVESYSAQEARQKDSSQADNPDSSVSGSATNSEN